MAEQENSPIGCSNSSSARPQRVKGRVQIALWYEPFAPRMDLGERKAPTFFSTCAKLFLKVEGLNDARTMLGKSASRRAGVGRMRRATVSAFC